MSSKLDILLVDDEKEFIQALAERLELRGFEPRIALSGEEALDMVQSHVPDVVVLDLKMPGIDGLEVLRRLKRDWPRARVIMVTGHGSHRDAEMARTLGAFEYLQKPVDIQELLDAMMRASTAEQGHGR